MGILNGIHYRAQGSYLVIPGPFLALPIGAILYVVSTET